MVKSNGLYLVMTTSIEEAETAVAPTASVAVNTKNAVNDGVTGFKASPPNAVVVAVGLMADSSALPD